MVTRSGTVYDYVTSGTISGADVYVVLSGGVDFYDEVTTGASGTFSVEVPATGGVYYLPYKEGYKGRKFFTTTSGDDISLYLESGVAVSGGLPDVYTELYDSVLYTSSKVVDLSATRCNLFVATSGGLDILDTNTMDNVGYLTFSGGFNLVEVDKKSCEDVTVYLGTSQSGVYALSYRTYVYGDFSAYLQSKVTYPSIQSNEVSCLSVGQSGVFAVGTISGLSLITSSGEFQDSSEDLITACFITPSGDIYYSPSSSGVCVKYGPVVSGWEDPDYILNTASTPAILSDDVNEIRVTPSSSGNTVFVATSSGISMYLENRTTLTGSQITNVTTELESSSLDVEGLETFIDSTYGEGNLLYSTDNTTLSGAIGLLDLEALVVTKYPEVTLETNLGRGKVSVSGSKVLEKR
jgi:hypothetical protein